jgi:hypothetical protein
MSKSSTSKVAAKKARGARGKTAAKVAREKARTARSTHRSNPKVVTEKAHVPRKTADPYRRIAGQFEAFRDGQVPGTVNAFAVRSVAQTREVYEGSKDTLQAVLESWEKTFGAAGRGAMALNRKIIDVADRNINNALDLATSLAGAKHFAEVVASHTAYWGKQFGNFSAQAREVRALSTKVAANVAKQSKPR